MLPAAACQSVAEKGDLEDLEGGREGDRRVGLHQQRQQALLQLREVLGPQGDVQRHGHGEGCTRSRALPLNVLHQIFGNAQNKKVLSIRS